MIRPLQTFEEPSMSGEAWDIEVFDPLESDEWDRMVLSHDEHSIFHRSSWARVLVETYGHQPFYLRISSGGGLPTLVPLMEVHSRLTGRRGVSLPFSDFAGPLWGAEADRERTLQLLAGFSDGQKWRHLELRGGMEPISGVPANRVFAGHELDLDGGIEGLTEKIPASTRRAVRKAERSELSVRVGTDEQMVDDYYGLHARTRRRHGLPPQPLSFFRSIRSRVFESGLGQAVLAYLGGKPVAGAVFLQSAGRAVYKFGASDKRYWNLRPNQLVMWTAIKHLISIGCHSLHFGRTSPSDSGLMQFKRSWGTLGKSISYFRRSTGNPSWQGERPPQAESHPWIFGRLPLTVNRVAGQLIYPHLD